MGMLFRIMLETRLKNVAVPARLELATFGLGNRCSIRLSYGTTGEISLYQRLLAFLSILANAHRTRTSKAVPVQIPVQIERALRSMFAIGPMPKCLLIECSTGASQYSEYDTLHGAAAIHGKNPSDPQILGIA
jgi:hypothetical protein